MVYVGLGQTTRPTYASPNPPRGRLVFLRLPEQSAIHNTIQDLVAPQVKLEQR